MRRCCARSVRTVADALVDPLEQIGKERIRRQARQEILVDDQRAPLAAGIHRAQVVAEFGRRLPVGLHPVQRVVHRNRNRQVRQREDARRIGQGQRTIPGLQLARRDAALEPWRGCRRWR
jgi:hypothetical protein